MKRTFLAVIIVAIALAACVSAADDPKVVYVLFNNHIEGEPGSIPSDPTCATDTIYQTLPPPPIGAPILGASFAVDLLGTKLLNDRTNLLTDSYGGKPKWFECPVGEFWQTESDLQYGNKLFTLLDYFQAGHEFGVQGHAIYYSNQSFCWYQSPHTEQGIQWKFRDMNHFADLVYHNGQPVNRGMSYTGGHKIESPALGAQLAERLIDSAGFSLGYRIAYEDHDGHLEDEPAGVGNSRPCYWVYEAHYDNGVKIVKIDMNGSITEACQGANPRCETPDEAISRFDATVAARLGDPDSHRAYYFAGVVHASGYFRGRHEEISGFPVIPGEYTGFNRFLDSLQLRIQAGVNVRFVTPSELASIFFSPKLHLTFVSHNEEPGSGHPDYLGNPLFYLQNRESVRQLAVVMKAKGASWNFQSDWNFLKAVAAFDTGAVITNTGGKNIVKWLVEDMGFEADPHAHESQYNYADVAYLHTVLGVTPSQNVGGFLYDPPDNPQGWEQHEQGTFGDVYPSYFWKPDNLWGAATYLHQGNDDCSFGVWKPSDRNNFYQQDSTKNLAYIGGGGSYLGVKLLLDALSNHTVPDSGFYTATIFIAQQDINAQYIQNISDLIDSIAPEAALGRVVWSPLTQTAAIWRTTYQARPFRLACSELPEPCICGDANTDGGIDISDAVYLIAYIFSGGPAPEPLFTGDANCDQAVDISDGVYLISYIFAGGPAPCSGCK